MRVVLLRWLKKSWYWLLILASAVLAGVLAVCFSQKSVKPVVIDGEGNDFPDRLQRIRETRLQAEYQLDRVRLEGELDRARVTAAADARRAELAEIEHVGENDPAAARRALATWLSNNL